MTTIKTLIRLFLTRRQYSSRTRHTPTLSRCIRQRGYPFFAHLILTCILVLAIPSQNNDAWAGTQTTLKKQYNQARAYYHNLLSNKRLATDRKNWKAGIQHFYKIYKAAPEHELAPSCLYMMGVLYHDLYGRFGNPLDLGESIANYEDITSLFPQNRLADDALYAIGAIFLADKKDIDRAAGIFAKIVALYPKGDMAKNAGAQLKKIKEPIDTALKSKGRLSRGQKAQIVDLRYGSTNYYTRVVIETSSPIHYAEHLLKKNKTRPRRLYVNLSNCRIPRKLTEPIPIEDGLLKQVRSAQYDHETVRVVLDTQTFSDYKITTQQDPFRVIIDVWGKGKKKKSPSPKKTETDSSSLLAQLGLNVRRIVLDPGHGGKDPGAVGPKGLKEKNIVLKLARKVAQKLRRDLGCEVILTRDSDEFLPLEERTEIANTQRGDIFISLHVNSAPSKKVKGVETYFLSLATSHDEMQAAAKENATSNRQLSDLQAILMDLVLNTKINESAKLAEYVQDNMVTGLNQKYRDVNNLGVKKAPFIVLVGAQMPAVLTEIAFLSNPAEAARLQKNAYLDDVAEHISSGVSRYIHELNLAYLNGS